MGKRTLVEWVARRSAELGVATVLPRVTPSLGPGRTFPRALALHLRCHGLSRRRAGARVAAQLYGGPVDRRAEEVAAVLELLGPELDGAPLPAPAVAVRTLHGVLAALGASRPVVVCLDNVEEDPLVLATVTALLDVQDVAPLPVLFLLTSSDENVAPDSPVQEAVEALGAHRCAEPLLLGPLSRQETWGLLRRMLVLDHELMFVMEGRSGGMPLVIVRLVSTCLQQGLITAGPDGFRVESTARVELPGDALGASARALDGLLASLPASERADAAGALGMASVLGGWVHDVEWREACARVEVRVPEGLMTLADRFGLVRLDDDDSWTWRSSLTRETLEQYVHRAGLWNRWHLACAAMLRAGHSQTALALNHRVGVHLCAAGELREALGFVFAGAQEAIRISHFAMALRDLTVLSVALDALEVPTDAPQRGVVALMMARVALDRGLVGDAVALIDGQPWRGEDLSPDARSWLFRLRAAAAARLGRHAEARGHLARAAEVDQAIGDPMLVADGLRMMGEQHRLAGEHEAALERLSEARALREAHPGHPSSRMAWVTTELEIGYTLTEMGRPAEGLAVMETVVAETLGAQDLYNLALARLGCAVALRWLGRHVEAEAALDLTLRDLVWFETKQVYIVHLHRALSWLQTGRYAEAVQLLARSEHEFSRAGVPRARVLFLGAMAWGAVGLGDFTAAQARLAELEGEPHGGGTGDMELRLALDGIVELAAVASRPELTRQVARLRGG